MRSSLLSLITTLYTGITVAASADYSSRRYDYVIVGAGTAGFVVGEYLSRDPAVSVLLLEAGEDGTSSTEINTPGLALNIPGKYFWNYSSEAEPDRGFKGFPRPQGHGLGGSSAVNYMQYCRASASEFDQWAKETGVDALAWRSIVQDFIQTSTYEPTSSRAPPVDKSFYGNGPVQVSGYKQLNAFDTPFQTALRQQLGLRQVDFSSGAGVGATFGDFAIRTSNSTRDYSLEAFGWQLARRSNVRIERNAWVTKIVFDGSRATGVTFVQNGQSYNVSAKETILSAGAIGSPKLLMLSGVGPKAHLQTLGIPLVADHPYVGSHLYDHHGGSVVVQVPDDVATMFQFQYNATFAAEARKEYEQQHTGYLSSSIAGTFAIARIPPSVNHGIYSANQRNAAGQLMFQTGTASFVPGTPNVSAVTLLASLTQPQSYGSVRLNSSDYHNSPLINSNYFGSEGDKAAIIYAYKSLRMLANSPAMKSVVVKELFPGLGVGNDDESIYKAIQSSPIAYYHPMGTTGLGRVLDRHFRVKGLQGIRVVDAGAFPAGTSCHPHATVYGFARAAARVIKEQDCIY